MADSRAPSGLDLSDPRQLAQLSQEDQDYIAMLRSSPGMMDKQGDSITQALGGGTYAPGAQNPFTDPGASYDKYRIGNKQNWNPAAYGGYSDTPYTLGMTTTTNAADQYMRMGGDTAYQAQLRANEAMNMQREATSRLGLAGANAIQQQGLLASQQQGMAGRAAGVKAGPVTGAQTLQGQGDYQGYLQQLAQGRTSADAMQAQASLFGSQYQNPDTTAAMMQHRQATDAALQSNLALARSSPGAGNMARAMVANAGATQSAAAQSAQLQAQQEAALRQAWMGAQGNAQQAYQGLAAQQGQMAQLGSQAYLTAQKVNQDAANAEAQRYLGAGQAYGAAANTWQGAGTMEQNAAQAYATGAQGLYSSAATDRAMGYDMAKSQVNLNQAKEARDYQEWLRQEGVRQSMGNQRYATMTGVNAANTAAANQAAMYNQQANARGTGIALQTVGSVAGAGIQAGASANYANAQKQPAAKPATDYDNPDSAHYGA